MVSQIKDIPQFFVDTAVDALVMQVVVHLVDVPGVQLQLVLQVVDMPVGVQRLVSLWFRVQNTAEAPQLQFPGCLHPCRGAEAVSLGLAFQQTIQIPQLLFDMIADVPVVLAGRVPLVQVVEETVLIPQLQLVKNIVLLFMMSICLGQGC